MATTAFVRPSGLLGQALLGNWLLGYSGRTAPQPGAGTIGATFSGTFVKYPAVGGLVATFAGTVSKSPIVINSAASPLLVAEATSDPLTGAPQVTLTITNTQAKLSTFAPPTAVIVRSDGEYVLGASPLDPVVFTGTTVVTLTDRTAPYGLPVSYIAVVTYHGITSAPSASAKTTMGQAPDTETLYSRLGWPADQDTSGQLLVWLSGIGEMVQAVDNLCTAQSDTEGNAAPGWSQVLDIARCPTAALPWLGQFVGVRVNSNARDDQQRYAIEHPQGFARGTPTAILAAANASLVSGYEASIAERDTGAYHLTVTIPQAGVIGATTCKSLWIEYPTCTALEDAFSTCKAIWQGAAAVTDAVEAAVPAGLGVSIVYSS